MHVTARLALMALASTLPLAAQTGCTPAALDDSAQAVAAIRHTLHDEAVPEQDPAVPPAIAAQLMQLKDALTRAAGAAFACAPTSAGSDPLQATLANALHANLTPAAESSATTRNKQDIGAYGSNLSVQVFQLTNVPKFFEVDFRYGIECGDDNLLLLYEASASNDPHGGWQQRLRWDAPAYKTVADALGDFVMLTPLTGDFRHPTWRFLIAHGHPGCAPAPRPTRFDLDLLAPSANPATPTLSWHFEHPYIQTQTTLPRLATTDDGIDFRIQPGDPETTAAHRNSKTRTPGEEIYRFRLTGNGLVEPLPPDAPGETPASAQPTPPTTSSPQ